VRWRLLLQKLGWSVFTIAFVIIAFVVWRISKMFIKEAPEAPAAPTKTCPFCKEDNAVGATKCRACASTI